MCQSYRFHELSVKKVKFLIYIAAFIQVFHCTKSALQSHLPPWLRLFMVLSLYDIVLFPLRSTPWGSIQDMACHILVTKWMQWTYLECICSANHHHLAGTHITDPQRDGSPSSLASSGARIGHLSHKSQTFHWLRYRTDSLCLFSHKMHLESHIWFFPNNVEHQTPVIRKTKRNYLMYRINTTSLHLDGYM